MDSDPVASGADLASYVCGGEGFLDGSARGLLGRVIGLGSKPRGRGVRTDLGGLEEAMPPTVASRMSLRIT